MARLLHRSGLGLERRSELPGDPEHSSRSAAELDAGGGGSSPRLPRYAVGIIHYRSYPDLKQCLESLSRQVHAPERIFVMDVESIPSARSELEGLFPEVRFEPIPNLGYAGGANRVLAAVAAQAPRADFTLLLNPDVSLEADFGAQLTCALAEDTGAALATGKLLRSDTGRIDSAGIVLPPHRRPRDRGSEAEDASQFDRRERVFGASGAALLVRMSALADLAIDGEVFDESFFMYHEDTDLAWRAQLLGWGVLYEPSARAIHVRRWRHDRRSEIEPWIRRHSFKNHYLQILKNERLPDLLLHLPLLLGWEVARLGFALLLDRPILGGYREAWRLIGPTWRKRRQIQARARARARQAR